MTFNALREINVYYMIRCNEYSCLSSWPSEMFRSISYQRWQYNQFENTIEFSSQFIFTSKWTNFYLKVWNQFHSCFLCIILSKRIIQVTCTFEAIFIEFLYLHVFDAHLNHINGPVLACVSRIRRSLVRNPDQVKS